MTQDRQIADSAGDDEKSLACKPPSRAKPKKAVRMYTTGSSGFEMYVPLQDIDRIKSLFPGIIVDSN